jgi:anti-sigma-K factor RskA
MTEHDSDNFGEAAAADALDALSPADRAAFEKRLAASEQARLEALEFGETAAELGLAVTPVQPSASLKANLMAQLAATPQLPPLATDAPQPAVETPAPRASEPVVGPATETAAERRAASRWFTRPAGILVAAAAAVALFFGGTLVGQAINSNQFIEQQASALAQINAAPDAQRATATTADGHPATLVWSGELGQSALLVDDLPALPSNEDYQLWYMNDAGAVSAGTFSSSGSGTAWRVLDGTMKAGDQVGVTVEPKGGSAQPTTAPILAIQS